MPTRRTSPISQFEIIRRPPSQNHSRLYRQNTDIVSTFKSSSLREEKSFNEQRSPSRPQTVPTAPTTYEVKRGGKIYKVVVGYVSPFTSPLQRKELHLKTDGEVDLVMQKLKQQQEKQRASKPQVWLELPSQSK
jgi:hypothetical protein